MAAANASLRQKSLVPERRKIIADVRQDSINFVQSKGFKCTPSVSNCFMVDVKKPGAEVMMAMRQDKVFIGRVWPSWPTNVRVTVGTKDEMVKFKASFAHVMGV
jgi:histidinol-phosphate/aromatic aminotransferase/cobyric acid decarboxylase-like protein